MARGNATDPLWRVGLIDPNGTIYAKEHPYGYLCTDNLADAEKDYENPPKPRKGWRWPVGCVKLFSWNSGTSTWDEIRKRQPRTGEFA